MYVFFSGTGLIRVAADAFDAPNNPKALSTLYESIYSPHASVRSAVIHALRDVSELETIDDKKLVAAVWFAKFDVEGDVASVAERLYSRFKVGLVAEYFELLVPRIGNKDQVFAFSLIFVTIF